MGALLSPMVNEQRVGSIGAFIPFGTAVLKFTVNLSRWERAAGGFHQPREKRVTFDRNIFSRVYPDAGDFRGGEAYLQFIATRSEPAARATDGWVIVISHSHPVPRCLANMILYGYLLVPCL